MWRRRWTGVLAAIVLPLTGCGAVSTVASDATHPAEVASTPSTLSGFSVPGSRTSQLRPARALIGTKQGQTVYRLWSDGWRRGQNVPKALTAGQFHAALTARGVCAWLGNPGKIQPYQWPSGWRVRFHPTVLLNDRGAIVADEGDTVLLGGSSEGVTLKGSRCAPAGGAVWAVAGSLERG